MLKCDIRKFFASIDQQILLNILARYIPDPRILALIAEVVNSFRSSVSMSRRRLDMRKGLPLGNLTSQLLVNIYMNEFDQFVKHKLKATYYVRYADDFVLLSHDKHLLECLLPYMVGFLRDVLKLEMHPGKVSITTFASGVDFLGWVHFPDHRVLRTSTKRRMLARTADTENEDTLNSYLGLLRHGNATKLARAIT